MTLAPRSGLGSFDHIHEIYYGTDDGFALLCPREKPRHDAAHAAGLYEIFARYEDLHRRVAPARRDHIHLASVVGGLYGLNLVPLFRPKEITFFDVNPHQIAFFKMLRRVWIESRSADQFLGKLADADYGIDTEQERVIRSCIAAKQNGTLTEEQGRSARSFLSSWRYALDHFELTRQLLAEIPVHTRVEDMQSQSFSTSWPIMRTCGSSAPTYSCSCSSTCASNTRKTRFCSRVTSTRRRCSICVAWGADR